MPHRRHFQPAAQPFRSWSARPSAYNWRPRVVPVAVAWQAPLRAAVGWDTWMRPYWDGRFIDFWRDRIAATIPAPLRRPAAIEGMLRSWSGPDAFVQGMLGPIYGGSPALPTLAQLLGLSWTSPLTRKIAELAGSRFSSTPGYLSGPFPGSNWTPGGLPTGPGAHPGAQQKAQASKAVLDAALAVVQGLGGIDYEAARDYLEQAAAGQQGTQEQPTIPTDPAVCVQTVLGLLQSDPQLYADVLKNAGSKEAVIARLEKTCGVISTQCGGMQPDACLNKLCPGVATPEQCYEQVFATEDKDKEEKSSTVGWIIGIGAVLIGGGLLYAAVSSK